MALGLGNIGLQLVKNFQMTNNEASDWSTLWGWRWFTGALKYLITWITISGNRTNAKNCLLPFPSAVSVTACLMQPGPGHREERGGERRAQSWQNNDRIFWTGADTILTWATHQQPLNSEHEGVLSFVIVKPKAKSLIPYPMLRPSLKTPQPYLLEWGNNHMCHQSHPLITFI